MRDYPPLRAFIPVSGSGYSKYNVQEWTMVHACKEMTPRSLYNHIKTLYPQWLSGFAVMQSHSVVLFDPFVQHSGYDTPMKQLFNQGAFPLFMHVEFDAEDEKICPIVKVQ